MKKPSAETQVSTGANEKRFINKTYIYRFLKQRSFASSRGTHSKTGKNTMKPLIRILSLWLAALCFGACTDDDLIDGTPTPEPETGIVIRLSAGDLEQTRTELTSQANLQHVEKVYALLYKGHGDDATFYACDELEWNPKESADETGVQEQREEFLLPQSENLAKGAYTVLCVGLDDKSGETYGLTLDKMQGFSTLKDAKATLAQDKGKEDIAKSELFAGWNQFHFAPDSLNIVEVEMKRRVAGVLCYLTDIPWQITQNSSTYEITKVQLRLFTNQNSSIGLCRKEIVGGENYPDDFGDMSLENSTVIDEFSMSGYSYNEETKLYTFDLNSTMNGIKLKENSILMGAYLVPIAFNQELANQQEDNLQKDATLQVVLMGKKVLNSGYGEEEIVRSFPAINDDIDLEEVTGSDGSVSYEPTKNYPIRPNIIYHIGNKPSDEEEGTPESLAGTEVKIGVKCWENETVDVEFPNVPIELGMQITDSDILNENTPFTMLAEGEDSETTPHYIFDCIGSSSLYLIVTPSVQYNKWEVNVTCIDSNGNPITKDPDDNNYDNMIYLKQKDSEYYNTYYTNAEGEDGYVPITIALTDYAKVGGDPIRRAKITLVGLGENGSPDYSTTKTMIVEQYNAILVNVGDDEHPSYRGFSRFNWHSTRDRSNGEVKKNGEDCSGEKLQWGYFKKNDGEGPLCSYIYYGYLSALDKPDKMQGNVNYSNAEKVGEDDYEEYWYDSAIYKCAQKGCIIDYENKYVLKEEKAKWYLPSTEEIKPFLKYKDQPNTNINLNEFYWSSYAVWGTFRFVWAYKIDSKGDIEPKDDEGSTEYDKSHYNLARNKYFYARQCCNIPSN